METSCAFRGRPRSVIALNSTSARSAGVVVILGESDAIGEGQTVRRKGEITPFDRRRRLIGGS